MSLNNKKPNICNNVTNYVKRCIEDLRWDCTEKTLPTANTIQNERKTISSKSIDIDQNSGNKQNGVLTTQALDAGMTGSWGAEKVDLPGLSLDKT
eukprot:4752324-Amphidinium_carterae.1